MLAAKHAIAAADVLRRPHAKVLLAVLTVAEAIAGLMAEAVQAQVKDAIHIGQPRLPRRVLAFVPVPLILAVQREVTVQVATRRTLLALAAAAVRILTAPAIAAQLD
jgi:hypothetical protein